MAGPYPANPSMNEPGYYPNNVGVACSNGQPGGDPRFNEILSSGVLRNPLNNFTVWPISFTVAVSEAAWGLANKDQICFQKIGIRNALNHSQSIEASIVDFCPASGCNWPTDQLKTNVDLYGQYSFWSVGGAANGSSVSVEIRWPTGIEPNAASTLSRFPFWVLLILTYSLLSIHSLPLE